MDFWRTYLHIPPTVQETERDRESSGKPPQERRPEDLHKKERLPEDPSVAQ